LAAELLARGPFRQIAHSFYRARLGAGFFGGTEETALAVSAIGLQLARGSNRARQRIHELRPAATQAIHRPSPDQPLNARLRHDLEIDALTEIEQVAEWATFVAGADDLRGGAAAKPLDRRQAEDDLALLDREIGVALLHIRRPHLGAEPIRVGDV